jgi:GNAT superfamily N-acetyltransferase
MRDHLLRLDPADLRLRFGGHVSPTRIVSYADQLDWTRDLVVGCVSDGAARGIGELRLLREGARAAELAVSVERRHQNRGIGTALLRRLVLAARNRLIERLHTVCLIDHGRAVRLARRLDGSLQFEGGWAEARIEPSWPTPWTWLEEALAEAGVVPALLSFDGARARR